MTDRYRPTTRRQRLVIIAVAATTFITLWYLLLYRPGGHYRTYPIAERPACSASQTQDCVGGKADVMLLPATVTPGAPPAPGTPPAPPGFSAPAMPVTPAAPAPSAATR